MSRSKDSVPETILLLYASRSIRLTCQLSPEIRVSGMIYFCLLQDHFPTYF